MVWFGLTGKVVAAVLGVAVLGGVTAAVAAPAGRKVSRRR